MVKAVALGVPVLATSTPAHLAAADRLGLDHRFLVGEGESWDGRIAGLRQDFDAVQDAILRARGNVLSAFSMDRIGGDWLRHIERALDVKAAAAAPPASSETALNDVALLTLAYRTGQQPVRPSRRTAFRSAAATSWRRRRPAIISRLFDALWETVASIEQEWVLFRPNGFRPTAGFAGELRGAVEAEPHCHVFVTRSQQVGFPADEWGAYAKDLRGTLCQPREPGLLLARRSWLMQQPWRPADCFSYWTWILLVQALSEGVAGVVATPVVLRDKAPAIANICAEYASSGDARGRAAGRAALSRRTMAPPERRRARGRRGAIAGANSPRRLRGWRATYRCRSRRRGHRKHRRRRAAGAGAAVGLWPLRRGN